MVTIERFFASSFPEALTLFQLKKVNCARGFEEKPSQEVSWPISVPKSLEGSVAWSWNLAQVHRTVKGFPTHILHPKSTRKVAHKTHMRDISYLIYTLPHWSELNARCFKAHLIKAR